jgi:predicted short-subunit dehydrogenase-like oxidoreductase (DUF2520 family)
LDWPRAGFIGTGRVGTALAAALDEAGYPVAAGWSRSTPALNRFSAALPAALRTTRPQDVVQVSDLVFLTVPDSLISVLAQSLSWDETRMAVHCSGALSLDVLQPAADEGSSIGSLHPLLPVASTDIRLNGAAAAIEGDDRALPVLKRLAADLGLRPIFLGPDDKPLYHAAAALLSNYTVTLFDVATRLFTDLGLSEEKARSSLVPLLRGVVDNLESTPASGALTGPIARGDVATVQAHLTALSGRPEVLALYCELGRQTLTLARQQGGLDDTTVTELEAILSAEQLQEVPA